MRMIEHLERISREQAPERKVLVCPNRGVGRELLRALAVRRVGWIGFEVATPRSYALSVAADGLAARGFSPMDDFEEAGLLDEALAETFGDESAPLGRLSQGVGFREAMANAVQALRLAGVEPSALAGARRVVSGPKGEALARALGAYERRLEERRKADSAAIFRAAQADFGKRRVEGPVLLVSGLPRGGLSGRFLDHLLEAGAIVLESDPVAGLDPPKGRLWGSAGQMPASPTSGSGPIGESSSRVDGAPSVIGAQTDLFALDAPAAGARDSQSRREAAGRLSFLFDPGSGPLPDAASPPMSVQIYAAASPYEEIREALRRAVERGEGWDEVEIVAVDPVVYGSALDEIATRLDIPVTYAVGLPVERSRPGRAAFSYPEWISADFPEALFRQLLASGDVASPGGAGEGGVSGGRLARRLRRLRVGWGRQRYRESIAIRRQRLEARDDEEEDRARELEELVLLDDILGPILEATPSVPDRIGLGGAPVSPADLARGLRTFLGFVPTRSAVEHEARERLLERLGRIEATLLRKTSFAAALAILRRHLAIRIPSPGAEGPPPWSSTGGHLHFSDLDHGGRTGRRLTFVVGLDADRFPGTGIQDPILLDEDRRRLKPDALPSAGEVLEERRYALAATLAGLRGEVTLSFSAWDAATGREVPPSGIVLQAHRLASGRPYASYSDLRDSLGGVVSPVPATGRGLDATDVWLDVLREDGLFRRGEGLIRASFRGLDRGITARRAHLGERFSHHLGRIEPRPAILDPRQNPELALSATALECLGACPLAYLHRSVLGLRDPDDPELDPGAWLEPRDRGRLLHAVYEESLRRARTGGAALDGPGFEDLAGRVLEEEISRFRGLVPAPSDEVLEREARALAEDMRVFVHMVAATRPHWLDLERGFGLGREAGTPIELPVEGGAILTRGIIDRVDVLPNGRLRVVDYKTGRPWDHRSKHGVFNGGRRLQHAIYANAAAKIYGRPVEVAEYHFPTCRGDERPRLYPAARFADAPRVIGRLLDLVAAGHFVPTEDAGDCRYCDHRPICRVRDDYGETHSPPADWAARSRETLAEFTPLNEVRRVER